MIFTNLLSDPDCPDCRTRAWVYTLHCLRCVARHIAREPATVAAIRQKRLLEQLDGEGFRSMAAMIAEERTKESMETAKTRPGAALRNVRLST